MTLPSEILAKDFKNEVLVWSLSFHSELSSSCMSELTCCSLGFTKLRGMCGWCVSCVCQMAEPVGKEKENVESFISLPREGILDLPHREEVLVWKMALWCCFYPIQGMDGQVSYPVPLCNTRYLGWHGQAAGAVFNTGFSVHTPPRCFPGTWVTTCALMSGFWEPTGKCLFPPLAWHSSPLVLPRSRIQNWGCLAGLKCA